MVYLGAGTSGRLGVLDASECLPTFGSESVIGVLAGAPEALTHSLEGVEDRPHQGEKDLRKVRFSRRDLLVGISVSGAAPYVIGGMRWARKIGAKVVGLTCNPAAPLKRFAEVSIIPIVGPEVVAGSSRMKAGTAQKLVLNMLSTAAMVRFGRVLSNRMVNVQLTNQKLWKRGAKILSELTGCGDAEATKILKASGRNLPVAILMAAKELPRSEAERALQKGANVAQVLREALGKVKA
jgi:N-acetylmuramic acid 6-phosphate etherase